MDKIICNVLFWREGGDDVDIQHVTCRRRRRVTPIKYMRTRGQSSIGDAGYDRVRQLRASV